MQPAVFLDRDGVLNEVRADKDFYYKPEDIALLPKVIDAIHMIKKRGYKIFVITNQPVIARGIATIEEIETLHQSMNTKLGMLIDQFYICPHHPEMHPDVPEHARKYRVPCTCRKPLPGMILEAAKEHSLDLKKSWMIGDMVTDVLTGKAAGCRTIQIRSPHSSRIIKTSSSFDKEAKPDFYADSLYDSVAYL